MKLFDFISIFYIHLTGVRFLEGVILRFLEGVI